MSDAFIVCSNLSFSWPDDTPVFEDLSFTVGGGRTGLVAPNGAGKSTLLRLIAGELRPSGGSVTVDGVLGYLPQNLPLAGDLTVAEVLGVAAGIAALHAIEAGDAGEEHFATIGDDWDIEERTRAELDRLGLGDVVARPAAGHPQRRPGRLARPGRAAAEPPRRAAARRADQQPRPGGPAQALRRARGLDRLPAAGQPRPGAARPDGPHRRAGPGRDPLVRRQLHRVHRGGARRRGRWPRATCATPSRRSSGRSGRCSRPGSGPTGGPATPPGT